MDPVKESFQKIKEDMIFLNGEINSLKTVVDGLRKDLSDVCEIMIDLSSKISDLNKKQEISQPREQKEEKNTPTDTPTLQHITPTHNSNTPTLQHIVPADPTHNLALNSLKSPNINTSTGNQGVPTDRQTDRQTDQHIPKGSYNPENTLKTISPNNLPNSIENASQILDSLDNSRKKIRLKFKRLTDQEILVFSTIYQLEEELGQVDYKVLADKLKLTESSIRDYTGRLIKKGIPVDKTKINNKTIILSISPSLKKIASLPTILQLRDI
jgi:hypothetical protein